MFKGITINMRAPICECTNQALTWSIMHESTTTTGVSYGLSIQCKTCGTVLHIPSKQFRANYYFDTPYPGVHEHIDKEPAKVLQLVPRDDKDKTK